MKIKKKIINERWKNIIERRNKCRKEGRKKGRGCVDQIFAMKRLMEGYLGKDKKLYAAFMDLEKAYDRVDREALWSVLRIYGVGGQLLKGIQAFYREVMHV